MIKDGFSYVCFLVVYIGFIFYFTDRYKWKIFDIIPPIIWIYLGTAIMATFGFFDANESVGAAQDIIGDKTMPIAICFLLLTSNVKTIIKLGPRLLACFFLGSATIALGFFVSFACFKHWLPEYAWKVLGACSATFVGGTENMVASAGILGLNGTELNFAILIDTVVFSAWLGLMLFLVRFTERFNKWTGADTTLVEEAVKHIESEQTDGRASSLAEVFTALAIGVGIGWLSQVLGRYLPVIGTIGAFGWSVIMAMVAGTILGMTPVNRLKSATNVGYIFLYILLANLGSYADFFAITEAPVFILCGCLAILIHGVLFLLSAKVFKIDLFTIQVASMANVGGESSAPVVAAVHNPALASIGILMGMTGVLTGTYISLAIAKVLEIMT